MIEFVNNSLIIDVGRYEKIRDKNIIANFDLVAITFDGSITTVEGVKVLKSRFWLTNDEIISFSEFKRLCNDYIK